jgi:glutamate racemase
MQRVLGAGVTLVDSAQQTTQEVRGVLMGMDALHEHTDRPRYRFFVTDEPEHFNRVGHRFLGQTLTSVERVNGHSR